MTLKEALLNEFESEVATTRKMLSRAPADKFTWKPHEKSMDLMTLSVHIADLPGWIKLAATTEELDFATVPYEPRPITTTDELLALFEESVKDGREHLTNMDPARYSERWVLRTGETIHADMNRYGLIRVSLSQVIHHRAQLGVYLRLLNVPIPGSYGPSADEMSF